MNLTSDQEITIAWYKSDPNRFEALLEMLKELTAAASHASEREVLGETSLVLEALWDSESSHSTIR